MTWIDWATVACVVYAALLSTLVAIRQQLRIRGEWEVLRYRQRLRANIDRIDLAADPGIQAGDPVYWDGHLPGCVTKTPSGNNQASHRLDAAVFGVAVEDSVSIPDGPHEVTVVVK